MVTIEKLKEKYLNSLTDNIEGSEEVLILIKELKDCIELLRIVDEPNMNALFNYEATDNFEKFLDVVESQINSSLKRTEHKPILLVTGKSKIK